MSLHIPRTLTTCIVAALALQTSAWASDGTITFTGAVTETSCTIQLNAAGTSDGAVALPVVDTAALNHSSAPKDAASGTFFNLTLSACAASHADISGNAPTRVAIYFEAGPTVDPATNALINAGTSNVEVKLYQASDATAAGSPITPGIADAGQPVSQSIAGASTQYFYAGYSAAYAAATPGSVSTSITYSLVYE